MAIPHIDEAHRADASEVERLEAETARPLGSVVADAEAEAQARFEQAEHAETVEFYGSEYRVAARVGLMPLLKFAWAASQGTDSGDMEGMAAMYEMLRSCFYRGVPPCGKCAACLGNPEPADGTEPVPQDPEACLAYVPDEWARFEQAAIDVSADDEDLFGIVTKVIEVIAARPTRRRSGSSPPGRPTSARSRDLSSWPATANLPAGLRPVGDLAR